MEKKMKNNKKMNLIYKINQEDKKTHKYRCIICGKLIHKVK